MSETDDIIFAGLLAALAETLGETVSDTRIAMYFKSLKRFDLADVERAIEIAIDAFKFFPKPVELIELIEGSGDSQAARAWQLVLQAIEIGGVYNSLFVEDHAIATALRRVFPNWLDVADQIPQPSDPMHASLLNRFRSAFTTARQLGEKGERYFVGYYESCNRLNVSTWMPNEDANYPGKVTIIARGEVYESRLAFSRLSGALTDGARVMLTTGRAEPLRLNAAPLPPARMIAGEAEPQKVQRQIAALADRAQSTERV